MPTVTVYHHGTTGGVPPTVNNHKRAKRGECEGWTYSSIRSNTRFLYSVDESGLSGTGFALTLTLKDCPPSHEVWHTMRTNLLKRLRRLGLVRSHWLTEWQRRGVPHLHAAIWLDCDPSDFGRYKAVIMGAWLDISAPYRSITRSQNIVPIRDSVGWFKYLSKHASRGLHHYQRSSDSIPEGWKKTGRMWGYTGDWSVREPVAFNLDNSAWAAFRRIVRGYRTADARASGNASRIHSARHMLTCHDKNLSTVRGISEWMEEGTQLQIMAHLRAQGYAVSC
jgi:hypothetical protein